VSVKKIPSSHANLLKLFKKIVIKHTPVRIKHRIITFVETHIKKENELKQIINRTK
jgi:hypothetical protein